MEGARWNRHSKHIDESFNGQLYDCMPLILLEAKKRINVNEQTLYETPVYRVSNRQSITMKSGHSNNFVTFFALKTQKQPKHWMFRGVALLCQLND